MAGKLDLAGLTDEEAKHIWNVIQRDFNLRKAEEDRLGTLKVAIEKEDTKTELLGSQTCSLADSHCIRCLQPFKFIMNSKRQCLDCRMYTCKSCSRYNKKEHGWVCDNCRMTRVLKVGTVGWYHDNVRTRFKRFGSAKVMRSLYKRLNGDGGRDEDTQSMPDVRSDRSMSVYTCHEDEHGEAEAQRYRMTRRNKRLLSVHPLDFDAAEDYFTHSRRQSIQSHNQIQEERGYRNNMDYHHNDVLPQRGSRRKSLAGYSVRAADDHGDNRMVRTRSLSKISSTMARQQYVDTSDEEDYPPTFQQAAYRRRPSRVSSQENLGQAMPITELNKRMSAIEGLLNRLEGKMTSPDEAATAPAADAKAEEAKLRRKLSELAGHLSEGKGGASSDEDGAPGGRRPHYSLPRGIPARTTNTPNDPDLSSSSADELPTDAQKRSTATALCDLTTEVLRTINATENALVEEYGHSGPSVRTHLLSVDDVKQAEETYRELEENVYITAGKSFELESKLRLLEHNTKNRLAGTMDSDLSDLEDVVALTAARVQSTESEVSDIENKIAALSAMDKSKKKMSGPQQRKRFTPDTRNSNSSGFQWKSNNNIF